MQSLLVRDEATGEARPTWTKQYRFLWMTWTVQGEVEDDYLVTEYSLLGDRVHERTPRWLALGPVKVFVGFLAMVSIFLMALAYGETRDPLNFFFLFGLLFLLVSFGVGYLVYEIFYIPPKDFLARQKGRP